MTDVANPAETRTKLAGYLREKVSQGSRYFKSKKIASELDLSSKEVGTNLLILRDELDDISIENWNNGAKEATWLVQPTDAD